jgi:hypothetical protein
MRNLSQHRTLTQGEQGIPTVSFPSQHWLEYH